MGQQIKYDSVPAQFPTHCHPASLWQSLGRLVATFGWLEETLWNAIYAYSLIPLVNDAEARKQKLAEIAEKLEKAQSDTLRSLIKKYEEAVRAYPKAEEIHEGFDSEIRRLRNATQYRNIFCHGVWLEPPDDRGKATILYNDRSRGEVTMDVDCRFLDTLQRDVAMAICDVRNTVTFLGWKFPDWSGPGKSVIDELASRALDD